VTLLEGRAAPALAHAELRSEQTATREAPPHPAAAAAPQPVLIAAAGHTCLAWWHAPVAGLASALPLAVVLASSWGEEDMAAYDDQRALAIALADAGLGTLRFEWPDTGDSSAATGATSVSDSLAAFDAAARHALALSGRERLAFVGLRLGALLAAHAAAARLDVDALVALMPVSGGCAFIREQAGANAVPTAPAALLPGARFDPAELPVSLGGFALSVRRLEALSALRWPMAATTTVLEALLLWPPGAASRTAADALARMGMQVHEWAQDDPSGRLAVAEIVGWLRERAVDDTVTRGVPAIEDFGVADAGNARANARLSAARLEAATAAVLELAAAEAPIWMRLRQGDAAVRERVVRIGGVRETLLAGVLGECEHANVAAGRPAPRHGLVLLSSGGDRRVGPHRLWVPWARRRAALGDVVLRLDTAGVGDSAPGERNDVRDVARALAWLRREQGVGACTVAGVGTGATSAWRAALDGVGVQKIIAIDPIHLSGRAHQSMLPDADTPRALAARARHALHRRARGLARLLRWHREDDLATEWLRASARGVSLNLVFSSRERGDSLLRGEVGRAAVRLVRDSRVTVCAVTDASPGLADLSGRDALYDQLDALVALPGRSHVC